MRKWHALIWAHLRACANGVALVQAHARLCKRVCACSRMCVSAEGVPPSPASPWTAKGWRTLIYRMT